MAGSTIKCSIPPGYRCEGLRWLIYTVVLLVFASPSLSSVPVRPLYHTTASPNGLQCSYTFQIASSKARCNNGRPQTLAVGFNALHIRMVCCPAWRKAHSFSPKRAPMGGSARISGDLNCMSTTLISVTEPVAPCSNGHLCGVCKCRALRPNLFA